RGPDDCASWLDPEAGIGLGFRRLSIIDLSELGRQPMASASGRYQLAYNGEVFNHRVLRSALVAGGTRFRGHSDTEVMLAAIEAYGVRPAVQRFVGMFAIALWDRERRELHLIRDRLGIKPLHVYWQPGLLAFGSELRAVMALPEVPRELDPEAVLHFLRYLYVPAPHSILRGVRKLLPGHHLVIRDASREPPASEPYWSLADVATAGRQDRVSGSDAEIVGEFERLLGEAVSLRLESDVPLGALLSGGIDSSMVVALMQAASSTPVKTFSIAFPGTEHDEGPMARAVAAHLGTEHRELAVDDRAALALAQRLPEISDEPFADPSQIPTYLISELARREVTVALTGDGGDELFGGYNRYLSGPGMIEMAGRIPQALRKPVGAAISFLSEDSWALAYRASSRLFPPLRGHRLAGEKARKLGQLLKEESRVEMYRSLLSAWQNPEDLVSHPAAGPDPVLSALGVTDSGGGEWPFVERAMLADQQVYLPDDLLAKVDRMSMAVGLEARVPILDHRVVEYSWRLRPEHKIRNGKGKWILREVLHRRVPRELVDRPKVGFTVPITDWLRGGLGPWAEELLSRRRIEEGGILDAARVEAAWREFHRGNRGLALGLWAVVMLSGWLDRWGR
ncbi:MAG TPA: asparagine synthase (glutamine-hydrolyzing), partial [Gemmatimonadales bacterium]|nr:asparagine synthase (glutamine-hydrolyzing) [Gemmatimonadales bacterium]